MTSILITGASRGIGLSLVKELAVYSKAPKLILAACRKPEEAHELQDFTKKHKNVQIIQLDTTKFDTFDKVVQEVSNIVGDEGLNCLINNAGILIQTQKLSNVTVDILTQHYVTNTVGPIMLTKAFVPLLKKAAKKNPDLPMGIAKSAVVNMSSVLGSVSLNTAGGYYGYRESKAALDIASRSISQDLKDDGILVTVLHPGWVKTDMGGPGADLTIEESVGNIVKTLHSLSEKHQSGFYRYDGKELQW
ncbi:putative oxidoreductase [Blattella germanica]|nr:putative oxidoreductase [Blattella germanica]